MDVGGKKVYKSLCITVRKDIKREHMATKNRYTGSFKGVSCSWSYRGKVLHTWRNSDPCVDGSISLLNQVFG